MGKIPIMSMINRQKDSQPTHADEPSILAIAGNLLAEYDHNKKLVQKYIYGLGLNAMKKGNSFYTYHFDGTGHTMAITDDNPKTVNKYAYTPYGLLTKEETFEQPFTNRIF